MDVLQPHKQKENPFSIDAVLQNVFQYCDFDLLEVCRNVCRQWEKVAERYWLEKIPVTFFRQNAAETNIMDVFKAKPNMEKWVVERLNKFCMSEFKFSKSWDFDFYIWMTHGRRITFLEIENCYMTSENAFWGIMQCKSTPLLQTLKFTNVQLSFIKNRKRLFSPNTITKDPVIGTMKKLQISYSNEYRSLPVHWRLVLDWFPNLEALILRNYAVGDICELTKVFEGIRDFFLKYGRGHPLSCFDVSNYPDKKLWEEFPNALLDYVRYDKTAKGRYGLKLEEFAFIATLYYDEEKWYKILTHQRNTLKRVRIRGTHYLNEENEQLPSRFFKVPPMLQLTRLDVLDYHVVSLRFLPCIPNLKHLNLFYQSRVWSQLDQWNVIRDDWIDWSETEKEQLSLSSLISFHCNYIIDFNKDDVLLLGRWAPNLQSLFLHANNSAFEGICEGFPKLQRLFLHDSRVTDSGITGMNHFVATNSGGKYDDDDDDKRSNITCLRELQVFGVNRSQGPSPNKDNEFGSAKLTNHSVLHGFIRVSSLKKLHISQLGMTASGYTALKQGGFKGKIIGEIHYSPSTYISLAMPSY